MDAKTINDIVYLIGIAITAKAFDILGYARCYADVCDSHGYEGDDLLAILDDFDDEKKENM